MASIVAESEILRPLLPSHLAEKYESGWPVFELTNAIVTNMDGGVVNLFSASEQNLLVVSGELVQKKEQSYHYRSGIRKRAVYIEVKPVGRYAFGSDDRGSIQIWAAGRSGWFELEPSLEYVATHADMTEAVQLWHSILDDVKLQNASAKDVFVPFMRKKQKGARSTRDVFQQHAAFLIEQMGESWSKKPLYQYLVNLQQETSKGANSTSTATEQPQPTMTARTRELKRRGRPPKAQAQALEALQAPPKKKVPARTPVDELKRIETEGAVLWKFVQRASETVKAARPSAMTMEKIGYMVYKTFVFDNTTQAIKYIRFQGPYLLKVMQERRQKRTWANTPFYNELSETVLTQSLIGKMAKIVLQVRDYEVGGELAKGGLDVYSSSDEDIQPHYSKSGLRPKSAGKGKGRSGKGKSYTGGRELEEDEDEQLSSDSKISRKRKAEANMVGTRRSKRNRVESISLLTDDSSEGDNGEEAAAADVSTAASSDIDEDQQTADKTLPLRWKSTNSKVKAGNNNDNNEIDEQNIPVVVKGIKLDVSVNAPGDVWHCTVLGCMQTIYGASGKLGSKLIDDHVYEHQAREDGVPQFSVVLNETKKTNLPVSNLIKRIREYAAAKELAEAVAAVDGNGLL